jgi:hypothetical protein
MAMPKIMPASPSDFFCWIKRNLLDVTANPGADIHIFRTIELADPFTHDRHVALLDRGDENLRWARR